MNKYKTLKTFIHKDALTGNQIKFARIIVPSQPTSVKKLTFPMDTVYDVPISEINQPKKRMQPLSNPDYNIQHSFTIYRKKMGLLNPKDIKYSRKRLGLSQPEVAAVLGLSVSAMSKVENNKLIQSLSQDTRLRCLTNWIMFEDLIKAHMPSIQHHHSSSVKTSDLNAAVQKIEKLKTLRGVN